MAKRTRVVSCVWSLGLALGALGCGPDTISTDTQAASGSSQSSSEGPGTQTGAETSTESSTGGAESCEAVLQADGTPTGFERCPSGELNRVSAEVCTDPFPPELPFACNEMYGSCSTSADCVAQPYGSCQMFGDFPPTCACRYGCTNDSECGEGEICLCAPHTGGTLCVEAECKTDADCPGDLRCGLSPPQPMVSATIQPATLHCRTPEDSCAGALDCSQDGDEPGECRFDGEAWSC